ncbi:HesA/MoeB/ThiF family protein [Billgrantia desiderata]|uniref:HesA/MoeB/ThiF family protein n=1 Tax=Billgrantia desiderata TaxID=52021 RepID=UPI001F4665D5|nr:ThiF family adenylyltransferase [Halomonas desiderata]
MAIPHELSSALEALPEDPRFEPPAEWKEGAGGVWFFRFRAQLSVPATVHVSEWTAWYLVIVGDLADPDIRIYPSAIDGIVATFPHQDYNGDPPEGLPWRLGKPCLERPAAVFRRDGWTGEPADFVERLIWRIGRLFLWIDAAATGNLLMDGDPLELPTYPEIDSTTVLGFWEESEDVHWLAEREDNWGFATISSISGARDTAVISCFMDAERRIFRRFGWSEVISVDFQRIDAVWVVLPVLALFEPWRSAATWSELSSLCEGVAVDLPQILSDAGAKLRRVQKPKQLGPVHLIIGFPLAERFGGQAERFHWIAIRNMRLCTRKDVRMGYSGKPEARRQWDRDFATSDRPLKWRRTANWAPDQLRKRGEAESEVRSKSVLIIGVGTLGASVAENLLRMGVTKMGLLDDDTMLIGNLSRHILTMVDAGHLKAERVAARLNMAAPDARVVSLPFEFPPTKSSQINKLEGWDVVIDCTASDAVLQAMGSFHWVTERLFVSLSMTWEAKGMFAYSASETGFPAIDAMERFAAVASQPDIERIGNMEGIGCWHPIFPATADDVNLWGSIGSKFIRRAILNREKAAAIFVQQEDGSVERSDA